MIYCSLPMRAGSPSGIPINSFVFMDIAGCGLVGLDSSPNCPLDPVLFSPSRGRVKRQHGATSMLALDRTLTSGKPGQEL